jgi:hypothetical protein
MVHWSSWQRLVQPYTETGRSGRSSGLPTGRTGPPHAGQWTAKSPRSRSARSRGAGWTSPQDGHEKVPSPYTARDDDRTRRRRPGRVRSTRSSRLAVPVTLTSA